MTRSARRAFDPTPYETEIVAIVRAVDSLPDVDTQALKRILQRYPKDGRGFFSKSELISGARFFGKQHDFDAEAFVDRLRMKPVRTHSGVAPVTVLTKPFPCPGTCIFCPNDVRMPKSYIASEPGAIRAEQNRFDPYTQTANRLYAFWDNGHRVDKVELIILGGTWSFYPKTYQRWFIKRCFDAMNDFDAAHPKRHDPDERQPDFKDLTSPVRSNDSVPTYNQIVRGQLEQMQDGSLVTSWESASWEDLEIAHQQNEGAQARCVGLVLETRPDHLDLDEVIHLRRLGATKIQLGLQSLSDRVLSLNRRGHDVAASRKAMRLLRSAGFKMHVHWMPNLYGSNPDQDAHEFTRLFEEHDFRPDELKIYPCSLIETAELMIYYQQGKWRPYDQNELLNLLVECVTKVPSYCRITRIIRDIPSEEIVVGNKVVNFRQVVDEALARKQLKSVDIRAREIRDQTQSPELILNEVAYETSIGEERFLEYVTPDDRIVGFLRLSLPKTFPIPELEACALIREVHVYGAVAGIGESQGHKAQHRGLGRQLIARAKALAAAAGFDRLAVISAVGTREYYRKLGFTDGELYQFCAANDVAEAPPA